MGDASSLGFGHFLQQSDIVARVLLVVLVLMSAISWYLIVYKGISRVIRQNRTQKFLTFFGRPTSLEAVQNELNVHGVREPFGHLTAHSLHAQAHHAKFGAAKLEETGSEQEFLTRTIKKVLDEETTSLENGLTMLATIGATAPFVGLFGTVWGVYHALVAIGMSGSGMLDKVAGPVGEALIMTGIGLAVALPAVMGYNWLTRSNRVLTAKLDAFAFELLTFLSMGRALQASGRGAKPGNVPLAEINMVPLIDVVLVLLVIFIVTAPLLTNAVKLDLPKATSTADIQKPEKVEFAIDASGSLFWNGERISREDAVAKFTAAGTKRPQPEIYLRADQGVAYRYVAEMLADASKAGLSKIAFVSEPAREAGGAPPSI